MAQVSKEDFDNLVKKVLALKPRTDNKSIHPEDIVTFVAKAIWEAGEAPVRWEKLYDSEQDEWREMARAAIAETLKNLGSKITIE
jgi:hypothetical protein